MSEFDLDFLEASEDVEVPVQENLALLQQKFPPLDAVSGSHRNLQRTTFAQDSPGPRTSLGKSESTS
jgi:hypothetical protein